MYCVPALHDVEHAQRIDGQHLHAALGVVVEDRGKVGRDGGDIRGPLRQGGRHLIGGGGDIKVIVVVCDRSTVRFIHELHHAHCGGALQGHHVDVDRIGRLCHVGWRAARTRRFRGAGIPGGGAACQQRGRQGQDTEQREQFFHTVVPF